MARHTHSRWATLVCVSLLLHALTAPAQPDGVAARAIERGNEGITLYDKGQWPAALARFREAESLYHSPVFLLYEARSLRNGGRLLEARETYRRLVGEVLEASAPEVWKDAHATGRQELLATEAELARLASVKAPSAPETARAASAKEAGSVPVTGVILAALGGTAIATGAAFGVLALHEKSEARANLPPTCQGTTCPLSRKSEIEGSIARAKNLGTVADVLVLAGAAAAATGLGLLIFVPRNEPAFKAGVLERGAYIELSF